MKATYDPELQAVEIDNSCQQDSDNGYYPEEYGI